MKIHKKMDQLNFRELEGQLSKPLQCPLNSVKIFESLITFIIKIFWISNVKQTLFIRYNKEFKSAYSVFAKG